LGLERRTCIHAGNEDCARVARPAAGAPQSAARSLLQLAELMSTYYQRKFVKALQTMYFATAAAVLAFLLYADVVQGMHPIVIVYLFASCVAIGTYVWTRRSRWQDRAQDYRALEFGLSVQQAWDAAGLAESVADYYIRRQRSELEWIRDAIRTAHTIDQPKPAMKRVRSVRFASS
jgi:hypothetical protein